MAIAFDGTGDRYAADSSYDWGIGTGDFTLNFWIQPAVSAEPTEYIISFDQRPMLQRNLAAAWDVAWHGNTYTFNTTLTAATAYWVCLRRSSGTLEAWVNGVQEAATHASVNWDMYTSRLIFGHKNTVSSGGSQWLTGDLCESAVWCRALTAAEISALHSGKVATHFPEGMKSYIPMRRGADVRDFCSPITFTKSGDPTGMDHPRVVPLPSQPKFFVTGTKEDSTVTTPDALYQKALFDHLDEAWNWETENFYMILVMGGAPFDKNHEDVDDVVGVSATNSEFDGSGYAAQDLAAGTFTMANSAVSITSSPLTVNFGTPGAGTESVRAAVLVRGTVAGRLGTDPVVAWFEHNIASITPNGVDPVTLTWVLSMFNYSLGSSGDRYYYSAMEDFGNGSLLWGTDSGNGEFYTMLMCGPGSAVMDPEHTTGAEVLATPGLSEYPTTGFGYTRRTLFGVSDVISNAESRESLAQIRPTTFASSSGYELGWINLLRNTQNTYPIRCLIIMKQVGASVDPQADQPIAWVESNIGMAPDGTRLKVYGAGHPNRARYLYISWPHIFAGIRSANT